MFDQPFDDSDRLKPCAHCGSDTAEVGQADDGGYFIQCGNSMCGMSTICMYATMDAPLPVLREKWNKRHVGAEQDAALWRQHRDKLDALVAYCPTCCSGFTEHKNLTRDEVIFECGKTVGRSESKALRDALALAHDHLDMGSLYISHPKDAVTIAAALQSDQAQAGKEDGHDQ